MRKVSLLIASLLLASFIGAGVLAQEAGLPNPGLTPDSAFYFLERISEGIGTFFTFGDLKKAERYTALATERVAETQAVVEKGKPEAAEKALKRYEDQIERALARAEKAKVKGRSIEKITETIAEATGKHLSVLEEVLEKVPEKAKEAIVKAKNTATNSQRNALRALAVESPERAIEINIKAIEARLNRAKVKAEEGETEEVEKALIEFENQYKFGEEISQIAQGLGKDMTTVEQLISKATSVHLEVLSEIYERVPEQAKPAIEKAMEVSLKRHEKAIQVLKEKSDLDKVPTEIPMPERVPKEVEERVEKKVQEEIEKEEIEKPEAEKSEGEVLLEEKPAPVPEPTPEFVYTIEADDQGFYIDGQDISSITASSGATVKISFKVRSKGVYFGGLDFRGCGQTTAKVSPGSSTTVEFTPTSSCTITSYWPVSNRVKDNLQVIVQ